MMSPPPCLLGDSAESPELLESILDRLAERGQVHLVSPDESSPVWRVSVDLGDGEDRQWESESLIAACQALLDELILEDQLAGRADP